MKKLTIEEFEDKLEEILGGSEFCCSDIRQREDGSINLTLSAYTRQGGDNSQDFMGNSIYEILSDIISEGRNFDPEEEFRIWYGARKGEPESPRDLLDDCDEKAEQWEDIANRCGKLFDELKQEDYDF